MKIIRLPLTKKYCSKCKKELPDDWKYDQCKECMVGSNKVTKIIKGAAVGGLILGIASAVYKVSKIYSKGND